jgi:HPt (histidine-containing phosphotransfer) domain-containing protein
MATIQHLDLTLINGYLEALDVDVLQQMLDLYVQQSQVYLSEIDETIAREDQKQWQEHCHKMKGSAASAGLSQVHEKLIAIEKSTDAWSMKVEHLNVLKLMTQQAIDAFKQWLSSQ